MQKLRQQEIIHVVKARLKPFGAVIMDSIDGWNRIRPDRLAAALAYFGMFSFAPMLYVILTVTGIFFSQLTVSIASQMFTLLADTFGADVATFVAEMVLDTSQGKSSGVTVVSIISLGALLYAATGLFAHLKYSLNAIWEVPAAKQMGLWNFVRTRLLAFVLVLGIGLSLVALTILSFMVTVVANFLRLGNELAIGSFFSFVLLSTLFFGLLYRILPDTDVRWRDVWPGALLAAVAFAIGRWALGIYLALGIGGSAFEAAGALAVILIAIFVSAQIFMAGALFSRYWGVHFGPARTESEE
jgi:membrane protein